MTLKPDSSKGQTSGQPQRVFNPARWRNLWERWQTPLLLFLALRLGLSAVAFASQILIPVLPRAGTAPYTPPVLGYWSERLLGVWSHWDGEWFLQIATNGYHTDDGTAAFFPLYPLLVKIVAWPLALNYLLAGVVVSSGATLAVLILFYELCRREWDADIATQACFYLAAYPFAFFLVAIYSESLFLALTLGAFLCARHLKRWWWAGLLAAAATLTRSTGFLLVLPLAWEWWQFNRPSRLQLGSGTSRLHINLAWQGTKRILRWPLLALGLPFLALAGWLVYNGVVLGDPLVFLKAQANWVWNRHSQPPWEAIWRGADNFFRLLGSNVALGSGRLADANWWEFPAFVATATLFGIACWRVWRRKFALSYLLYFGLAMLLPLSSPGNNEPLLSFPRFALVLFPMFMVLALLGRRWRWLHYMYIYTVLLLLGLFLARFANWYWVA